MKYYAKLTTLEEVELTKEEYDEVFKSKNNFGLNSGVILNIAHVVYVFSSEFKRKMKAKQNKESDDLENIA